MQVTLSHTGTMNFSNGEKTEQCFWSHILSFTMNTSKSIAQLLLVTLYIKITISIKFCHATFQNHYLYYFWSPCISKSLTLLLFVTLCFKTTSSITFGLPIFQNHYRYYFWSLYILKSLSLLIGSPIFQNNYRYYFFSPFVSKSLAVLLSGINFM